VTGGLSLTVWSALVVPLPALALSVVIDGPAEIGDGMAAFGWRAVGSTAYTVGMASLVGYTVFNSLLARYPAAAVVPWVLLAPVVAMTSAWALLDERPTGGELAGGALLVVGVLIAMGVLARRRASAGELLDRRGEPLDVAAVAVDGG
jgi:O-acetylserine/cysteine efflux transporter